MRGGTWGAQRLRNQSPCSRDPPSAIRHPHPHPHPRIQPPSKALLPCSNVGALRQLPAHQTAGDSRPGLRDPGAIPHGGSMRGASVACTLDPMGDEEGCSQAYRSRRRWIDRRGFQQAAEDSSPRSRSSPAATSADRRGCLNFRERHRDSPSRQQPYSRPRSNSRPKGRVIARQNSRGHPSTVPTTRVARRASNLPAAAPQPASAHPLSTLYETVAMPRLRVCGLFQRSWLGDGAGENPRAGLEPCC